MATKSISNIPDDLLDDLRKMIVDARRHVARTVDTTLIALYWNIGRRIRQDILKEKRSEYGRRIVSTLSRQLVLEFGKGFSRPNLFRMIRFAEVFPDEEIVSTLSRKLGWSHFVVVATSISCFIIGG